MCLVAAEKRCANEGYSGMVGAQRFQYDSKYLCPSGYNIQEHVSNKDVQCGQYRPRHLCKCVRENTERTGENTERTGAKKSVFRLKKRKRLTPQMLRYQAFQRMVPVVGLEPTRSRPRRILNPLRLPFHHTGPLYFPWDPRVRYPAYSQQKTEK